ncbi:GntR family transcriptional regulator [Streptomyces sp. NPDC021100]|uniref:GntR family transcriptional regulator n=1 Tax=Streptomyces sp. NPDC021100 TaxID=3365114 RepID=UPI00378A6ADF
METATADIHCRIVNQEFHQPDGTPGRLPAAGELGRQYGLSRQAMNRVIDNLKSEGLVRTRAGSRGAMVQDWQPLVFLPQGEFDSREESPQADIYTRLVQSVHRKGTSRMDRVGVMPAQEPVRSRLGLRVGEFVAFRLRTNIVDGMPVHTDDSYVPLRLVEGSDWLLDDNVERGTNTVLAELGHELVRSVDELTPRTTRPEENTRLALGEGNSLPAIELLSTGYDRDGRPVQVTAFTLPRHRNTVVYERTKPAHQPQDTE